VQERVVGEVGGCAQGMATFEQLRAANWKMIFFHQQFRRETAILATSTANCEVNPVADEMGQPFLSGYPHVDITVGPPKPK
jgi:hypothetical protein